MYVCVIDNFKNLSLLPLPIVNIIIIIMNNARMSWRHRPWRKQSKIGQHLNTRVNTPCPRKLASNLIHMCNSLYVCIYIYIYIYIHIYTHTYNTTNNTNNNKYYYNMCVCGCVCIFCPERNHFRLPILFEVHRGCPGGGAALPGRRVPAAARLEGPTYVYIYIYIYVLYVEICVYIMYILYIYIERERDR